MSSHSNLAAVLVSKQGPINIQERPIPSPGQGELLVRNHAVAANPVDWKIQQDGFFTKNYPAVLGSDIAGVVEAIGAGVTHFKVGDRVTGFAASIYKDDPDHGGFQTYSLLPDYAAAKVPANITFEQASVFPMGVATAGIALFADMGIPRTPYTGNDALLVWGAASSMGVTAVQIARSLGWSVFATASPAHHGWLRQAGATEIVDYRDPDVTTKLATAARAAGKKLRYVFDAISEGDTYEKVLATLTAAGTTDGAIIIRTLTVPETPKTPEGTKVISTYAARHGTDQQELGRWLFNNWLETQLLQGKALPLPEPQVVEGGLASTQSLLNTLKAGVSGKKLVIQVQ